MLKADFHRQFKKDYKKLPKSIQITFAERLPIFLSDPNNILLKDHALTGFLKDKRAFAITGDYRVIYRYIKKDLVLLLRIGTHNQVY